MPKHPNPNQIIISGEVARMRVTKRSGEYIETIFDVEDIPKVRDVYYRWFAHYEKRINNHYIAAVGRKKGERKQISLSRLIMDCPSEYVVDHINHNTLDNRKVNLRVVPQEINLQNKAGAYRNSKTGVRGVHWHKATGKWYVQVNVNSRKAYQQLFDIFEEACTAAEIARKTLFREVV